MIWCDRYDEECFSPQCSMHGCMAPSQAMTRDIADRWPALATRFYGIRDEGTQAMIREPSIPGPPPEQEVEHLAGQCSILLRENERLKALNTEMLTALEELVTDDAAGVGMLFSQRISRARVIIEKVKAQ